MAWRSSHARATTHLVEPVSQSVSQCYTARVLPVQPSRTCVLRGEVRVWGYARYTRAWSLRARRGPAVQDVPLRARGAVGGMRGLSYGVHAWGIVPYQRSCGREPGARQGSYLPGENLILSFRATLTTLAHIVVAQI